MKKLTAALLALLTAASMTACGKTEEVPEDTSAAETTAAADAEETEETSAESETESEKSEETKAETEETTETAEEVSEKSENEAAIEDVIKTYAESDDKGGQDYHYYDDKLLYTHWFEGKWGSAYIDLNTYTAERITDDTSKEWYTYYDNGSVYSVYRGKIRSLDEDGNVIASFVDDNQQMLQMQCLSDGNAILDFYDVDAGTHAWGIYNSKLELVKELPKLTEDAGHGETKNFDIESIYKVLGNRAFVKYKNGVEKVLDLDTMELSDLEDRNYLFSDNYRYKLVGKYFWDAGTLFDAELYKTYDYIFQDYDAIFVTDKNFYYAADNNLYRYVNENEGELVYDGSASKSNYGAVSEDHFIVYDDAGTFLVDMATGEEHKITLNE